MEDKRRISLCSSSRSGEDESLLFSEQEQSIYRQRRVSRWKIILGILVLLGSNLLTCFLTWRFYSQGSIVEAIGRISGYSPLYGKIDIHIDDVVTDQAQIWDNWDNETTVWRQDPSEEVDKAWHQISNANPMLLTRDEVVRLGKDPETTVQWPYDSAKDVYLGKMNVFHLTHCVDQMRKAIFADYYERSTDPTYWTHIKHCIDIVRQEIMCTASLDVTVLSWTDVQSRPFPNFEMHRKCRRWEDIISYRDQHVLNDAKTALVNKIPKPKEVKEWKQPQIGHDTIAKYNSWLAEGRNN